MPNVRNRDGQSAAGGHELSLTFQIGRSEADVGQRWFEVTAYLPRPWEPRFTAPGFKGLEALKRASVMSTSAPRHSGKWHNTPATQTTAMGPFMLWPTVKESGSTTFAASYRGRAA